MHRSVRLTPIFAVLAVLAVAAPFLPSIAVSQSPTTEPAARGQAMGRIIGRVLDAELGTPIPLAIIEVVGTPLSAQSDVDGRFMLERVPAGTVTVQVRRIGYGPKTVTGVVVAAGGRTPLDVLLQGQVFQLEGITVTAVEERGSVARALDEQRTSNQIVNAVSAEQIRRSPDSDAGQAVQRVSGVTVQDGRYVFVRGLGERYTTTALNGARIPSPEPERKMVPLDLFPSGLLNGIVTTKTFTPDQPGDFSGAQVNLQTRDFLLDRVFTMSTSVGVNDAVTGTVLPFAPTVGGEWLGSAGAARALPELAAAGGTLSGLSQAELNEIINSFRNTWTSESREGGGKGSFAASLGGSDPVFGHPLDYLASFTYSYDTEARVDERKAWVQPGTTSGAYDAVDAYRGGTGRTSVLWGGLLNVGMPIGGTGRLRLENTFTRSGENEAERRAGFHDDFKEHLDVSRLTFTERRVRAHQLRGDHLVAGRHGLDWLVSSASVRRYEPDRSDLVYQTTIDSITGESRPFAWFGSAQSARRTFNDLRETGYEAAGNYRHELGGFGTGSALKIGAVYKTTDRDSDTRSYEIVNVGLTDVERRQPAEAIFNGTYASLGKLFLTADAATGRYAASERLVAGYAQLELPLGGRWKVVGGVRVEDDRIEVNSTGQGLVPITAVLDNTDLLPALSLTYALAERHTVRFSVSQTLSRPDYRELSPVTSFEPLSGQSQAGNPSLRRALIQNADMRWEWYPAPGQVVSAAVFAKRFTDPIERVLISVASIPQGQIHWVNADRAHNYGLELEARTNLGVLDASLLPLSIFVNTTLMRSEIEPGNDTLSSLTSSHRPMVGQAEYVVNAGLTYAGAVLNATLLYNTVGPRIREAGILPLPDVIEEPRHVLDLSLQAHITAGTTLKLDAKNLLDTPYALTQGTIERHYYRSGRSFTLGASWTP